LKFKMKGDDSTHHSGHQIHPQQQVLEARVVAELRESKNPKIAASV